MYDNDDEEINDKFNLKSFTRQPAVIFSPGVSVNIVTYEGSEESTENKNDKSNLFNAEEYGRMMIQERKDAINTELRKLELEILELDKELEEDEVVKEAVEIEEKNVKKIIVENGTVVAENSIPMMKNGTTLYSERKVEVEVENKRINEEREAIIEILLFSVLSGELNIEMSIEKNTKNNANKNDNNNSNDNDNDNNNNDNNNNNNDNNNNDDDNNSDNNNNNNNDDNNKGEMVIDIVTFSVKDYFSDVENTETGIEVKNEKKNSKKETNDEIIDNATLIIKYLKTIPPVSQFKNSDISNNNNKRDDNLDFKKPFNYFITPESESAKFLVEAFEVSKYHQKHL